MAAQPPPPPKWVLDLNSAPSTKSKASSILDPPGFTAALSAKQRSQSKNAPQASVRKPPTTEETDTLKLKKAWEIAIAPAKQLPMNAIGMYMTGSTLQIFSIFMVFTLFKTPLTAIATLGRTFAPYTTPGTATRLLPAKLVFVVMNLLMLGLGLWKVNQMGLLPTTRSDWLAWEAERTWAERGVPAEWL